MASAVFIGAEVIYGVPCHKQFDILYGGSGGLEKPCNMSHNLWTTIKGSWQVWVLNCTRKSLPLGFAFCVSNFTWCNYLLTPIVQAGERQSELTKVLTMFCFSWLQGLKPCFPDLILSLVVVKTMIMKNIYFKCFCLLQCLKFSTITLKEMTDNKTQKETSSNFCFQNRKCHVSSQPRPLQFINMTCYATKFQPSVLCFYSATALPKMSLCTATRELIGANIIWPVLFSNIFATHSELYCYPFPCPEKEKQKWALTYSWPYLYTGFILSLHRN